MKQTLKTGTRIEMPILVPGHAPELATIARWTAVSGPIKNVRAGNSGYHIVKFADGGSLCVHESRFRVIDNRQ